MTGFYEKMINLIIIVSLLLAVCVCVDYADTNITNHNVSTNVTVNNTDKVLLLNESESTIHVKSSDKIHTEKQNVDHDVPLVTITSKPSCGCRYGYYWHTNTFVSYCPHCHKYGTLRNVHKWQARYEQELTCDPRLGGCGADYCGCCGKEKYSWSHYYLTRV